MRKRRPALVTRLTLLAGATFAVGWAYHQYAPFFPRLAYLSGWALFLLILVLTAYNSRKKLPFIPLGSSSAWLQFHVYAGFFTLLLFGIHIRFQRPTGWFESGLALVYLLVVLSGGLGLLLNRSSPRRLTTKGGEVLWERIPVIRRTLQERAETLMLASVADGGSTTMADFYGRELHDFFAGPRNIWRHVLAVQRPRKRLLDAIEELSRYLDERERPALAALAELVRQKDGLDRHYAIQGMLKIWLFAHIPLTGSLVVFALVHLILVFAFSGGAP